MRKLIAGVAFVLLIGGAWFLFANPFNIGVQKSAHFTVAKFDAVRNGDELIGKFTFDSGKTLQVRLPRQLPYWER